MFKPVRGTESISGAVNVSVEYFGVDYPSLLYLELVNLCVVLAVIG